MTKPTKAAILVVPCLLGVSLLAADDPFVGTWKLNAEKSKFAQHAPRFMLGGMVIESTGTGLKSTFEGADEAGITSHFTFNCPLDGSACNVTNEISLRSSSAVDTVALRRVDPHTIVVTGSKKGKVIYSDRRVVSMDGMTMTVSRKGTTSEGNSYESLIVLDRSR